MPRAFLSGASCPFSFRQWLRRTTPRAKARQREAHLCLSSPAARSTERRSETSTCTVLTWAEGRAATSSARSASARPGFLHAKHRCSSSSSCSSRWQSARPTPLGFGHGNCVNHGVSRWPVSLGQSPGGRRERGTRHRGPAPGPAAATAHEVSPARPGDQHHLHHRCTLTPNGRQDPPASGKKSPDPGRPLLPLSLPNRSSAMPSRLKHALQSDPGRPSYPAHRPIQGR